MDRIAVLADIHGNLPALEAVLTDVERAAVDLIVLNGDLADGPFPAETLDLLAGLEDRAFWLRGNGDRWLVESQIGRFKHPDPATDELIHWASKRISGAQHDRLAALSMLHRLTIAGLGKVGLCHATCRSDNEMFLVDGTLTQAEAAFASLDAETVVVGHCHMPFDRLADRRRIVNAGSVGMPYGHSGASWALVGPDIVLKRTPFDVEQAAQRILATGMPGAEQFVLNYVRATPGDAEALDTYHAVVRRQQAAADFG
jgi:putative phosphoesterase